MRYGQARLKGVSNRVRREHTCGVVMQVRYKATKLQISVPVSSVLGVNLNTLNHVNAKVEGVHTYPDESEEP